MKKTVFAGVLGLFLAVSALAQVVPLHVDGRYFKDPDGRVVNLHGFAQTYSPWFNERGTKWTNYDVRACLAYNQSLIDDILAAGWKMDFVRLHMDPYWSNIPGRHTKGENDISAFSMERFKKYLDEVFVPMAEYAIGKGLYVIMRPPGVCPMNIRVGDDYQKYLMQVWDYVSRHPRLRNNAGVMFELANEPVNILGADGRRAGTKELTAYLQPIVKKMRRHCRNILLIPGLGGLGKDRRAVDRRHPEKCGDPHPEDGARAARDQSRRAAGDVAGADLGRDRGRECLEGAHALLAGLVAAQGQAAEDPSEGGSEFSHLYEICADGKEDAGTDQQEEEQVLVPQDAVHGVYDTVQSVHGVYFPLFVTGNT